jgi:hypothetical protein
MARVHPPQRPRLSHRPFRGRRCSIGNSRHRSRDLALSVPHIGASPVPQPRGTIQSEVLSTLRTEKGPPGSWDPGGPSCQCCGNMVARARTDRCRAARSVALPSWQLTADGVIRSALRFGHSFDGSRMVLPRSDRGGNQRRAACEETASRCVWLAGRSREEN